MNPVLLMLRVLGTGAAAGLIALVVDLVLARRTLGYVVPLRLSYLPVYVVVGATAALLVFVCRRKVSPPTVLAASFALIYLPSLAERVFQAVEHRAGAAPAWLGVAAVTLAYAAWIVLLERLCRPRSAAWAWSFAGLAAAVVLAVNRNAVDHPLETAAILADLAVVLVSVGLVVLLRTTGPRPALLAATVVAVVGFAIPSLFTRSEQLELGQNAINNDRPHLLLVIIDTVRQDVFREVVQATSEGQRFAAALDDACFVDNAVAAAPWTAPSVGSIMTGLYPDQHGFGRPADDPNRPLRRLASSVPTLAEHLATQGYFNIAVGTNTILQTTSGIDRGFHRYEVLQAGTEKLPLVTVQVKLGWRRPELYQPASAVRRRLREHLDDLNGTERPVFFWLHLMDPHQPLNRHPRLHAAPGERELDEEDRLYYRELRYALDETRKMLELYRARLPWDRTVAVIVGDHGEMFLSDDHGFGVLTRGGAPELPDHGHALYDELVHVPLVLRPPGGVPGGIRQPEMVSHVDLLSTVTDLLGVPGLGGGVDRVSVAGLLSGEDGASSTRRWALVGATQTGPTQYALRGAGFKIIHYPGGERPDEVYHLITDPREQVNLAGSVIPEVEEAMARLEQYLAASTAFPETEVIDLDPDTRDSLEALGYLGG